MKNATSTIETTNAVTEIKRPRQGSKAHYAELDRIAKEVAEYHANKAKEEEDTNNNNEVITSEQTNQQHTMKTFKITANLKNTHSAKPTNVGAESINTNTPIEVNLDTFSKMVCQPSGRTWCPAVFVDNKRKNDTWIAQQLFSLDFDNGTTPTEALDILASYNIVPNIIYPSFSDTPELRKFRLIILLDEPVTDANTSKWIIINLMNLFAQKADKACKDLSRMFFGSKAVTPEFYNEIPTANEHLMAVLNTVQIANDRGETKKCILPETSKNGANGVSSIYTKEIPLSPSNPVLPSENVFNNGVLLEHFNFDKASDNVQIFADFLNGRWLFHNQIFGIATSLRWIKGGLKLMKEIMNKFNKEGKTFYSTNNFAILTYVNKMNYTPTNLANYSEYEDDHQYVIIPCIALVADIMLAY